MSYNCKHFTKPWTSLFPPAVKEVAGEESLYRALLELSNARKYPSPILLAPYEDPALLARTEGYPDVYQKIDDVELLYEVKDHFYYHSSRPGGWGHPAPFYQQSPKWVRDNVEAKRWWATKIPVRNSRKQVWLNGKTVWQWTDFVYVMNSRNIRKCYVSTVNSFTPDARTRMDKFFGERQVYTDHAILSPEMCTELEDVDCAIDTGEQLILGLAELIGRELRR